MSLEKDIKKNFIQKQIGAKYIDNFLIIPESTVRIDDCLSTDLEALTVLSILVIALVMVELKDFMILCVC